jgi:hypothetical protein
MNDVYQSPAFLKSVAAGVAVLIILVFALIYPWNAPKWSLSQHYMFLNACIKSSRTADQLAFYQSEVDNFINKHFKSDSKNEVLKGYYSRLLKSISEKQFELNGTEKAMAC